MHNYSASPLLAAIYSEQLYTANQRTKKERADDNAKHLPAASFTHLISQPELQFLNREEVEKRLENLNDRGLIEYTSGRDLRITEKGRELITVVLTGGAFDIIHPGHIETLQRAKSLGDVLVVSVARNATYLKNRKKDPLHDEEMRRELVQSLKPVDVAILGSEGDIFETVLLVRPDIIALGYDQSHNEEAISKELESRGLKAKVIRLDSSVPSIKSSKIIHDFY